MKKSGKSIAYFCMEYGLTSDFKIYSGGLGILAGDMIKSSHEMGAPITFVGILWRNGYNTQLIDSNCNVIDKASHNEWQKYVQDTGKYVDITIKGRTVAIKIWKHKDYPLFLLDTNLEENGEYKDITANLYGNCSCFHDEKLSRIAQEMILSIGGIKALEALGIKPDIYHFNEGHPVFGALELISREKWYGHSFERAIEIVRKFIVFTTHTPIEAGNESHDIQSIISMGANCYLSYDELKRIGGDPFNMTVAALQLSSISNGVSKLHAKTAQKMWEKVANSSPIIAIPNGVHQKTWQDPIIDKAFSELSLDYIYERHLQLKENLIDVVYKMTNTMLDQNGIIIGFARRATYYKRWPLIFTDLERLQRLFKHHNIQLVFSGKSHKNDTKGKDYIKFINQMSKKYPQNVIFLEDYSMEISKVLVTGCDCWLNNPLYPLEACGTSGMKAALNGVLNISIPDGWWEEGCIDKINGWAFGSKNDDNQDYSDAISLYQVLENRVLPAYYNREKWTKMMFASILTAQNFTSERMVIDYLNNLYNC